MMTDRRQYTAIRWTITTFSLAVVMLSSALLWRAWPLAITPKHSTCGCAVGLPVSTGAHVVAEVSVVVAGAILGAAIFGLVTSWYSQRTARRSADRRLERIVHHEPTNQMIRIVSDDAAEAFSLGWWRPQIYISTGLLRQLTKSEMIAVIRHEQSHCQLRDPLWATVFQGLDRSWGKFMPWIRHWTRMAISLRELVADSAATDNYQRSEALASAMTKLMESAPQALAAMSPNTSRLERLLNQAWQPNWRAWRWTYVGGAAIVICALMVLGRVQPAAAKPLPVSSGSCHQIQIICQAEIKQRQVQCANDPARCTNPISWLPARLMNYSPLHE